MDLASPNNQPSCDSPTNPAREAECTPTGDELFQLCSRRGTNPFAWCGGIVPSEVLDAWRRAFAKETERLPGTGKKRSGILTAAAAWTPQAWDSRQIGIPTARVELLLAEGNYAENVVNSSQLLRTILEQCGAEGIGYVTARADTADLASIHSLQNTGFELLEGIQTFAFPLAQNEPERDRPGIASVGAYCPWQEEQVLDIAKSAYRFDRFHVDPALDPGVADSLHREWIRNSCNGSAADIVVTAHRNEEVLGFLTLKLNRTLTTFGGPLLATIVLVGVKESGRGFGIGRQMTSWALDWLRSNGTAAVQVGTQFTNVAAARLYARAGFQYAGSCFTFRKLL